MPDLYGIKQTLTSGNQWNKTEPTAGSSITNGIKTYNADTVGGLFDFSDAGLLGTASAEISRIELNLNGLAGGDTFDIYIFNGSIETLWWSLSQGVHIILAENAGELVLPSGYQIRCACSSNTTANTTADFYATEYGNLLNEVRMLHIGEWQIEIFVKTGSPTGAPRNVAVGSIDYEVVKVKDPAAANWASPIYTFTRYYWYQTQGDTNPIKIGPQT